MVRMRGFGLLESIFLVAIAGTAFVLLGKQIHQKNEQVYLENMVTDIKKIQAAGMGYAQKNMNLFVNGLNQIPLGNVMADGFIANGNDFSQKYGAISYSITADTNNKSITSVVVNIDRPKGLNNNLLRQDYSNYVLNKAGGANVVQFN